MLAKITGVVILIAALTTVSAGQLWASPSHCSGSAIGAQTGMDYDLVGEDLVTETTTTTYNTGVSILWGVITLDAGGEVSVETTVQYYRGTYEAANGTWVQANCSTGQVV
jgi:hypothetical protein